MSSITYLPGVCNIGPAEIARRRRVGLLGLFLAALMLVLLIYVHAPVLTRLVVALPAALSAIGFLQARSRFCVGFARSGIFNFGRIGHQEGIADVTSHAADVRRASWIMMQSVLIGLLVGCATLFI